MNHLSNEQLIENANRLHQLRMCNQGDLVELTTGEVCEFDKMKRKNFLASKDGQFYNIPVEMFVKVVKKAKPKAIPQDYLTLKYNELFYIKHKDNASLYRFETIEKGRIIGINVANQRRTKIDIALYGGKVSQLLKED